MRETLLNAFERLRKGLDALMIFIQFMILLALICKCGQYNRVRYCSDQSINR